MKVVIISATHKEILPIKEAINSLYIEGKSKLEVSFCESGVGILSSCFSISKLIFEQKPDLIIQAGIAGTFDKEIPLSEVVVVKEEVLGDTGVEESGDFKDLFDLNLQSEDIFPFFRRRLINGRLKKLNFLQLREVTAITINEITTRLQRIEQLKTKYNPAIESMEGASLHYCCLQTSISFIQIRAISNYIGERDKAKWELKQSFINLRNIVFLYLDQLLKAI
ncbi:MAG: futalosine hydrolase [Segetibacter sp.]